MTLNDLEWRGRFMFFSVTDFAENGRFRSQSRQTAKARHTLFIVDCHERFCQYTCNVYVS